MAAALAAAAVAACAAPSVPEPSIARLSSHARAPEARAELPPPPVPAPVIEPAPAKPEVRELARFHRALRELEAKKRAEHVRIYWIGDSHGQADFWSGQLRSSFAQRFGSGGPGYVYLGYKNYRHDGLKLETRGKWRMRPKKPVTTKREGDGVYGLGGLMMSGYADAPRVELRLTDPVPGERVVYDLCFRFHNPDDSLTVEIEGGQKRDLAAGGDTPAGAVHHVLVAGSGAAPFVVTPRGRTDLCGVAVEADASKNAGVVLDTIAINGARFGTMLAWDEEAWGAEVARRPPNLVVFELGTNEAGDGSPRYADVAKELERLLQRVRAVAPESDCVVVSPTDRADAEPQAAQMRATLKEASASLGCFWFDAWEILGGQGAMARLRQEPDPKVQPDGIHLTIKGYRELGAVMFGALTAGL